jgi:hypothetical protein
MQEVNNATDSVRNHNVGKSDYAKHKIQPWDIWIEFQLNPFDADLVKRTLRTKAEGGMTPSEARKLDYEKIIHISSERIRQLKSGVEWPTPTALPNGARVDEIIEEYQLNEIDAEILDNLLMREENVDYRIGQYGVVIECARRRIEALADLIAEEKKKAENDAKKQDKKQKIIDFAEKTAKECLKKISEGMSTYKHISKSMESLLTEIDSKDQIDMFND